MKPEPGRLLLHRSVDYFRCESITLKSHWVLVVMDQFSRRIIGFGVHAGDVDGIVPCSMFNRIIAGTAPPRYLSSDHDPPQSAKESETRAKEDWDVGAADKAANLGGWKSLYRQLSDSGG